MSSLNVTNQKSYCIIFPDKDMENRKPAENIYKDIGKNIVKVRKQFDLTQQELATKVNSSRQTIALYETGVRRIPIVNLVAITKVLHINLEDLIPEYQKKRPGPTPKIKQSFERINELPETDQNIIISLLDSLYQKSKKTVSE